MLCLLLSLLCPQLQLSLFKGLLRADLVKPRLSVLRALLHLPQPLHFSLLFFLDTLLLAHLSLLSLQFASIVLRDLLIDFPFDFPRRDLLLLSVLVGDSNLFVHDLDHPALSGLLLGIFALSFLDVGEQLGLLQLSLIFQLLADLQPLGDLVNEHLLTALSCLSRSLLSCHLILNCFKTFNFHHHIESLLLLDPVLLEDVVLFQLLVTHRHDL